MHPPTPANSGFKRQVVFRISAEDWPLLEHAAAAHGSIQAAVLAGLRALAPAGSDEGRPAELSSGSREDAAPAPRAPAHARDDCSDPAEADAMPRSTGEPTDNLDEEIPARTAAKLLGLKTSTVSGYIRSGRLPGRYDGEPSWRGWLTTRAAVSAYRRP